MNLFSARRSLSAIRYAARSFSGALLDASEVAKLFERAAHFSKAVSSLSGSGCSWSYTFPDGETHRYIINGLKSPEQLETEILSLAIWLWNLKDYLKERSVTLGKD